MLVAASILPIQVREGTGVGTLTAGLTVYRIGGDGKIDFVRKYDVEATKQISSSGAAWSPWPRVSRPCGC